MKSNQLTDPTLNRRRFIKRNAKGGIHEFFVRSSSASPMLGDVDVHWHVLSSGKRTTLFRFLFLKWLWDELTSQEWKFCLNLPEFFSSVEFVACARALASGTPKKVLRTRLNNFLHLRGLPPLSQQEYISRKGLKYDLNEVALSAPTVRKYSGWARHHKDHGSLREALTLDEHSTVGFSDTFVVDLFKILSVGKVVLLGTELSLSPDDDSKESKRNAH